VRGADRARRDRCLRRINTPWFVPGTVASGPCRAGPHPFRAHAMDTITTTPSVAQKIAEAMLQGFDKHYRLFCESSAAAKQRFEAGEWAAMRNELRERIRWYDDRVKEAVDRLRSELHAQSLDDLTWQQVKLQYIGLLTNHKQPELAETFFNSVFCRIMYRTYFHNDFIFFRPAISTEYIESDPPTYRSYYPTWTTFRATVKEMLSDFGWTCPFIDLERDASYICASLEQYLGGWPIAEANLQIQVLNSAFYRNKGAYVIGKVVNGHHEYAFAIPVLRHESGELYADTVLLDPWRIGMVFSLSRAYFMVDMPVPSAYVQFLRSIMPWQRRADLYTMLGLQKQGKNMFYRDLAHHLKHSRDAFRLAPGIPGLVMVVFTLPSFPYVFKVIRDRFAPPKEVDHATVKAKYLLVKQHDRAGRMADTLEFSEVALPTSRMDEALLKELRTRCADMIEEDGERVIVKHCYIERRMQPLNIYLDNANAEEVEHAIQDYGRALRELAHANIFPGDLLFKNFGITRYGRVVFYDYDEIEYLTDCNFRRIPPAPYDDFELSGEPWYSVARNDVFPEEFANYLLASPRIRDAFMRQHADLLQPDAWQEAQRKIRSGEFVDFYPYPETLRYSRALSPESVGAEQRFSLGERYRLGATRLSPLLSEVEIE
jgi:isocitrate dehydrogenase kinase/phosphatase